MAITDKQKREALGMARTANKFGGGLPLAHSADTEINSMVGTPAPTTSAGFKPSAPPLISALRSDQPGSGAMRVSSTGETATVDTSGNVSMFGSDGQAIKSIRKMTTTAPGGALKVGNMDVGFSVSTSPEAKQAFMQNPVRPTAQIDRFAARQQAEVRPAYDDRPRAQALRAPELLTRENSPGMGWKQRTALNEQMLKNFQADKDNAAQAGIRGRETAVAADRNAIEREQMIAGQPLQNAQLAETQANTAEKTMSVEAAKRVQGLQAIIADEKSTPAQRVKAASALRAINSKPDQRPRLSLSQGKTIQGIGPDNKPMETVTSDTIVDLDTGTSRPVVGAPSTMDKTQATQKLASMKDDPNYDVLYQFFVDTYGEEPKF